MLVAACIYGAVFEVSRTERIVKNRLGKRRTSKRTKS